MVCVTTVALIERRPDISRSLFTRYWRDVHGVMAARIPGFDTYTQNHVTPLGSAWPFEGIAIVTFAEEADRVGLVSSPVTRHIHRDEQNVFRRALLYNLSHAATVVVAGGSPGAAEWFFVVAEGGDVDQLVEDLQASAPRSIEWHDLTSGDPAGWNGADVDDGGAGPRFVALVRASWADREAGDAAARMAAGDAIGAYALDERHLMVENGRPTPVGLRGLDAVRTIEEAGAVNQLAPEVVRDIYGMGLA
jgi:hypothetical protein